MFLVSEVSNFSIEQRRYRFIFNCYFRHTVINSIHYKRTPLCTGIINVTSIYCKPLLSINLNCYSHCVEQDADLLKSFFHSMEWEGFLERTILYTAYTLLGQLLFCCWSSVCSAGPAGKRHLSKVSCIRWSATPEWLVDPGLSRVDGPVPVQLW